MALADNVPTEDTVPVAGWVNGERWQGEVTWRSSLLEFLRDDLGLSGSKRGCEVQSCGACTVLVDDRPVSACGVLAADLDGAEVWTIEGLSARDDPRFAALQRAFMEQVAFQCGFCTSGQLCLAQGLLLQVDSGRDAPSGRSWMSNNLCRCGSYYGIEGAVASVDPREQ